MQAIGLIETKGLIPAIESADVMLKTSQVELIEKAIVGGGLVTITVSGDVGAVKAAVDAGEAAVLAFGQEALISRHVIARPHVEVGTVLFGDRGVQEKLEIVEENISDAEPVNQEVLTPVDTTETVVIEAAEASDDYSDEQLAKLSISELRKLAEKESNLQLSAKVIKKANRATLIKHLKELHKNQIEENN